jgi:hypothetical protein
MSRFSGKPGERRRLPDAGEGPAPVHIQAMHRAKNRPGFGPVSRQRDPAWRSSEMVPPIGIVNPRR